MDELRQGPWGKGEGMTQGIRAGAVAAEAQALVNIRIVRWAVLAIFFINGTASATWVA